MSNLGQFFQGVFPNPFRGNPKPEGQHPPIPITERYLYLHVVRYSERVSRHIDYDNDRAAGIGPAGGRDPRRLEMRQVQRAFAKKWKGTVPPGPRPPARVGFYGDDGQFYLIPLDGIGAKSDSDPGSN